MKFSFTYYPEFLGLEQHADYIEINGLPLDENNLKLKNDWLFHFRRDSDGNLLHLLRPEQIKGAIKEFEKYNVKPEIISLHLGFPAQEVGTSGEDNHNYAISEVYSMEEILKTFSESLGILSDVTETLNIPIAVENLDYHAGGAYEYVCEPPFIRSLLKRNPRTNLLLDVAHAEISAHELCKNYKEDERATDYIGCLPLEKVIEIHLNSTDERFYDMHYPAAKREINLLKHFKEKMPSLNVVNLEYNNKIIESPDAIKRAIPMIREVFAYDI